MIEINELFTVAAPPGEVYAVLSDPAAVVECVAGASLGERHEDGTFDGAMTVKFSALRVSFSGRVGLELDEQAMQGTVHARGRDGQGGTKFQATASFTVAPAEDEGAGAVVTANGQVELSGKLAAVIEGAASAVVKRMTLEFVQALSLRCASGPTEMSGGQVPAASDGSGTADSAPAPGAVLLLHGFGGSPGGLRGWSEALAATGAAVSVPRLPGHGTRWRDLDRTTAVDWYQAASDALTKLLETHGRIWVMGVSLGATLALRLAEQRPDAVTGVVAVNPAISGVLGSRRPSVLTRVFRRSVPAVADDVKKAGATDIAYTRVPLRAARSLARLGSQTLADAGRISAPVLLALSAEDHVVPARDGEQVWASLPARLRQRMEFADSYHLVPIDNDSAALFAGSVSFMRSQALATT